MKISIILPIYNGEKFINQCLSYVYNLNYNRENYEVIIIDDGSTDNSREIVQNFVKDIDNFFYYFKENGGASSARNFGVSKSKYNYLAFTDSDAYVDKNWLKNISQIFNNGETIFGGKIDNYNSSFFSHLNHITEFSEFYENKIREIKTIPSVNLAVTKELFNTIGGFDEKLQIGEDSDFSYRARKLGYKTKYFPDIVIFHDTPNIFFSWCKKQYKFGNKSFEYRKKNQESNYQFVFNKNIFLILFFPYIFGNIFLYFKRKYFYKHFLKSILGLLIIFIYRFCFWVGVGKYILK